MSYAAAAAKGPKQSPEEVSHTRITSSACSRNPHADALNRRKCNQVLIPSDSPKSLVASGQQAPGIFELDLCLVSNHIPNRHLQSFKPMYSTRTRHANHLQPRRRAPPPPEILHDDSSTASLIDVDSPHISSVPSSYAGETTTQAEREEREAEEAERAAKEKFDAVSRETGQEYQKAKETTQVKGKEAKSKAKEVEHEVEVKAKEAGQKAKEIGREAGQKAKEVGREVDVKAREAGKKAKEVGRDVSRKVDEAAGEISENRDNPVVIGNAVIIGLGSLVLGFVSSRQIPMGNMLIFGVGLVGGGNTRLGSWTGRLGACGLGLLGFLLWGIII